MLSEHVEGASFLALLCVHIEEMVPLARMMLLRLFVKSSVGTFRALISAISFHIALGLYLEEGGCIQWMKYRCKKGVCSSWTETERPVHLGSIKVF